MITSETRLVFNGIADHWHYSNTPLFSLSSSSAGTGSMITREEALFIAVCLEGFFYGKISVPCALTCTLAIEFQIF